MAQKIIMSKLLKSKILLGVMIVAVMLVGVAFTATDASAAYTMTLKQGMRNAEVSALQAQLGVTPATGYFGSITKAAVMAFQANNNLTPVDGIVGPMTRAALNAGGTTPTPVVTGCEGGALFNPMTGASCSATPVVTGCENGALFNSMTGASCTGGTTPTPNTIGTGEGDIINVSEVSSKDSKLQEGKTNELFAFTAEVDGDVSVDRVDFYIDSASTSGKSNNADDYFKSASLMINGTTVGTVDVKDFTEDNYYTTTADEGVTGVNGDGNQFRVRFSGLNSVFTDGAKPKFVLAFEALSSIDGTDVSETWGVGLLVDSIRFVDGKGFSDNSGSSISETFTGDAQDVAKLSINSSSNNPEITTFEVSSTDETKDVQVFKFNIEEENDVDVTVEDMTITLTAGTTVDESAVVSSADLYQGSELLGSESVSSSGVANFTDLGLKISAGKTEELTLKLTFADNSAYTEGETIKAVVTSITKAEDANNNDESDMTITGEGLSSKTHILRSTGISVLVKNKTTEVTVVDGAVATNPDTVEFVWNFDVSAFGDKDVYVNSEMTNIVATGTAEVETIFSIGSSAASTLTALSGTIVESDSDVTEVTAHTSWTNIGASKFFKINKGTTGTFTLTVTGTNLTAAKQVRGLLENIEWTTTDVTTNSATALPIDSYTSNLGSDAATPFKSIN